jgi:hypothetical protein
MRLTREILQRPQQQLGANEIRHDLLGHDDAARFVVEARQQRMPQPAPK